MIEKLEDIDRELFLLINHFSASWLDPVMIALSEKFFWIPVYMLILFLIFRQYGWKIAALSLLSIGLMIAISDQLSVKLFKEVFERYRPCHNLDLIQHVRLPTGDCGGKFGFVSSHATNHFGLSVFLILLFRKKTYTWILLFWAVAVSYSRMYLGVHYPSDVIAGGLFGAAIAVVLYFFFTFLVKQFKIETGNRF